jgi:hypothetical protein
MSTAEYCLHPAAQQAAARAILITGAARSGTSMLGTLIHSLQDVEYVYEPPLIFSLIAQIDAVPRATWSLLYQAYLFEEILADSLAGRRLNLNEHDESCVLRAKAQEEVTRRLSRSHSRAAVMSVVHSHTLAFKAPDILPFVPRLLEYYPNTRLLVTLRDPVRVAQSLVRKGWFSDDTLRDYVGPTPVRGPERPAAPYWVAADDLSTWRRMGEAERALYYYLRMYGTVGDSLTYRLVDYSAFVADPYGEFARVARELGCEYGLMTRTLLQQVAEPSIRTVPDLPASAGALLDRAWALYEQLRARSVTGDSRW